MQWDGVLVRFGEIGIKSAPVRRAMVKQLRRNLLDGLLREKVEGDVERIGPRLLLAGPDTAALLRVATHTFGVVSASPVRILGSDLDDLGAAAAELALERTWTTFAIRAKRDGKHAYSSQEANIEIGKAVWRAAEAAGRDPQVDLSDPDLRIHLDIRGGKTYLYTDKHPGPGGLPAGSQGHVVLLASDPSSFVAAWLLMRRGSRVELLHAGHSGSLPLEGFEALAPWGLPQWAHLLPVCSGTVAKAVLLEAAATIAQRRGADAVATGDRLDSRLIPPGELDLAILRPCCGLDEATYQALADRIGIEPFEPEAVLDDDATETTDSLLGMHRKVDL
ncbi:MAG: THUMP domain-containing protein [Thermoplasmatota archaeon]